MKNKDENLVKDDVVKEGDANRDPITKAPGAHPVGVGVGAAGGGAAGAAIGSLAGPVGTAVGARYIPAASIVPKVLFPPLTPLTDQV